MISTIVLVAAALGRVALVQAQTTEAQCDASYGYLNNTLGQSPCLIAAYLQQACLTDGGNWNIPELGPGQSYTGPDLPDADYCSCSSVVYSLTSACARCQNHISISWSNWAFNCTDITTTITTYPLDIPPGTAVPAWAYQNVTVKDQFDLAIAQNSKGAQSTYFGTPTASINYHLTAQIDLTTTATSTGQTSAAAANSGGGSKSNVGPIVGGVVGGIAVLALLGLLVWLIKRNQHKKEKERDLPPATTYPLDSFKQHEPEYTDPHHGSSGYAPSPTLMSDRTGPTPKLYDPADPSTFPATPASFGYTSTAGGMSHSAPTEATSGRYTGAAEI